MSSLLGLIFMDHAIVLNCTKTLFLLGLCVMLQFVINQSHFSMQAKMMCGCFWVLGFLLCWNMAEPKEKLQLSITKKTSEMGRVEESQLCGIHLRGWLLMGSIRNGPAFQHGTTGPFLTIGQAGPKDTNHLEF